MQKPNMEEWKKGNEEQKGCIFFYFTAQTLLCVCIGLTLKWKTFLKGFIPSCPQGRWRQDPAWGSPVQPASRAHIRLPVYLEVQKDKIYFRLSLNQTCRRDQMSIAGAGTANRLMDNYQQYHVMLVCFLITHSKHFSLHSHTLCNNKATVTFINLSHWSKHTGMTGLSASWSLTEWCYIADNVQLRFV